MATAKKPAAKTASAKSAETSTAVAVKKSGSLVDIKELMRKQLEANKDKVGAPSGNMIRISQDKKFTFPDGNTSAEPFEAVVVDFVSRNSFYEGAYDPKELTPPACFAIGSVPTKLVPSENSPVKQCDTCAVCPMNQFGSSGTGKACKNSRVLALLPPDATDTDPIWLLTVSPTALKSFDGFVSSVARQFELPPVGVVVTIGFDEGSTYPSLRFFDPKPNVEAATHLGRIEEAAELLNAEPDVSQYSAPKPPKRAVAPRRR
jgi:hypothetical protein